MLSAYGKVIGVNAAIAPNVGGNPVELRKPTHGRSAAGGYALDMSVKNNTWQSAPPTLNFAEQNFLELLTLGAPQAEWLVKQLANGKISHAEAYQEMQRLSEDLAGPLHH